MSIQFTFRALKKWPGTPTRNRKRSQFDSKHRDTMQLLERELSHLQAKSVVIEADCRDREIRRDGMLRADTRLNGPGIVLRFESPKGAMTFPCDTFREWQDNLRAIAKALEALRMVDRYGVTSSGEQYRGWTALPDKSQTGIFPDIPSALEWLRRTVGGTTFVPWPWGDLDKAAARRDAVMHCHPDRNGGNDATWNLWLQAAAVLGIEM